MYAEEKVHVVQKGDTIYSIARAFFVDKDELMKYNGITDPTKLQAGQRLRIPAASAVMASSPAAAQGQELMHKAAKGDTFYGIARRYGITVDELLAANSLAKDYILKLGDMLRIPGKQSVPAPNAPAAGTAVSAAPRPIEARDVDASVRWPVTARELSYMTGKMSGVVVTGDRAEAVKSLSAGTVISAGPYRGFGRIAIVQAAGAYLYVYGGCESLSVKEGDIVGSGTELGRLGIDAVSGKPQLFFMVYRSNAPVDPAKAPRT
ncbi:LysM domain/M23/M37 peptidase domain protein [Leadbettera azotonutricia ZAS-9]|uniref:LysM domain/M23/M37 peptidase domain protein n=1 Tax=Leadbettera azotonutricia (strain ATCC BAA-888 / DSM 13862 / ZAS-9) TaxID=545695 RepID=F5Y8D2_LEAAZ|nr:LysM domain/M23/M37 peptidase domain protein [Leadbettera azotonutricia ZAS-9]